MVQLVSGPTVCLSVLVLSLKLTGVISVRLWLVEDTARRSLIVAFAQSALPAISGGCEVGHSRVSKSVRSPILKYLASFCVFAKPRV